VTCNPDRIGHGYPPDDITDPKFPMWVPPYPLVGPITSLDPPTLPTSLCADIPGWGIVCADIPDPLAGVLVDPPYEVGDDVTLIPLFPPTRPVNWVETGAGRKPCSDHSVCGDGEGCFGRDVGEGGDGPNIATLANCGYPEDVTCDRSECQPVTEAGHTGEGECDDVCGGGIARGWTAVMPELECCPNAGGKQIFVAIEGDCEFETDTFTCAGGGTYKWVMTPSASPYESTIELTHVSGTDEGLSVVYRAHAPFCCVCCNVFTLACGPFDCGGETWRICVCPLCTVCITAIDDTATEAGPTTCTLRICRSNCADISDELEVFFTVTGTATTVDDYDSIGTSATIPAGESCVDITITPVDDEEVESPETVIVTLDEDDNYLISQAEGCDEAICTILSDDVDGFEECCNACDIETESGGTLRATMGGCIDTTDDFTFTASGEPCGDGGGTGFFTSGGADGQIDFLVDCDSDEQDEWASFSADVVLQDTGTSTQYTWSYAYEGGGPSVYDPEACGPTGSYPCLLSGECSPFEISWDDDEPVKTGAGTVGNCSATPSEALADLTIGLVPP
jgi:hypothetical protein